MIAVVLLRRILSEMLERYRDDGYVARSSASDYGADYVFVKDDEAVLIQIKMRNLRDPAQPSVMLPHAMPEVYPDSAVTRRDILWLPIVNLPSVEDTNRQIERCQSIVLHSSAAALLYGFSAIETAALRMLAAAQAPPLEFSAAGQLITELRDQALIDEQQFEQLVDAFRLRNYLAHGRLPDSEVTPEDVQLVLSLASDLNNSLPSRAVELIDSVIADLDLSTSIDKPMIERTLADRAEALGLDVVSHAIDILRSIK